MVLRLFMFPVFVIFGMALPWREWIALGWGGVALAVGILLLRRVPMMLVFHRFTDQIDGMRDALFADWFGPNPHRGPLLRDDRRPDGRPWDRLSSDYPRDHEFGADPRRHRHAVHEALRERDGPRADAARERVVDLRRPVTRSPEAVRRRSTARVRCRKPSHTSGNRLLLSSRSGICAVRTTGLLGS